MATTEKSKEIGKQEKTIRKLLTFCSIDLSIVMAQPASMVVNRKLTKYDWFK